MPEDSEFYTATMAKVYAGQGHWDKAVEIYQYLLRQDSSRKDYVAALKDARYKLNSESVAQITELSELIGKWVEILLKLQTLEKLRKYHLP